MKGLRSMGLLRLVLFLSLMFATYISSFNVEVRAGKEFTSGRRPSQDYFTIIVLPLVFSNARQSPLQLSYVEVAGCQASDVAPWVIRMSVWCN